MGFLDLQQYVEAFRIEEKGLKKLSGIVLGRRISKSQQVSNWDADLLTEAQLRYAATDAWICLKIYYKFERVNTIKMAERTRIVLKSGKDQSLRRYHPWVFSGAIKKIHGPEREGYLVDVLDNKDEFPGHGPLPERLHSCKGD